MKLLMHACCAPCSVYCIDTLRSKGIEPTIYWYNPNIHPYSEYKSRLECLKQYTESINCKAIFNEEYGLNEFCKNVENRVQSRCVEYCYPLRLRNTFEYAKQHGYDTVTTTLLYSIYQKHEYIKKLCEDLSKEYQIDFLYIDFRVGYWEGHEKAKELGLYMQKYCGCIYSADESALGKGQKPVLPEGFEFVKRTPLEVKRITDIDSINYILNEKDNGKPIRIEKIENFEVFGIKRNEELLSLAVISNLSKQEVEIKEIITKKEYRHKGFGTKLLKSMIGNYKQKYKKIIVGTTGDHVPFFVQNGFNRFIKQEGNIIYYEKDLQKNKQ